MKYQDAFEQLVQAVPLVTNTLPLDGWRLYTRPRVDSMQVELQHEEKSRDGERFWYTVAHVDVSPVHTPEGLQLRVYINCTMCGRWSQEKGKAEGLKQLFAVADLFEKATQGQAFES